MSKDLALTVVILYNAEQTQTRMWLIELESFTEHVEIRDDAMVHTEWVKETPGEKAGQSKGGGRSFTN